MKSVVLMVLAVVMMGAMTVAHVDRAAAAVTVAYPWAGAGGDAMVSWVRVPAAGGDPRGEIRAQRVSANAPVVPPAPQAAPAPAPPPAPAPGVAPPAAAPAAPRA